MDFPSPGYMTATAGLKEGGSCQDKRPIGIQIHLT